jgi:acyl carrier protein
MLPSIYARALHPMRRIRNCPTMGAMKPEEVLAKVKEILEREFEIAPQKVVPDATFVGTLGMDSLDVVDFVSYIEFAFEIDVGLQAYRDINTVQKLVDVLVAQTTGT